MYDDPISGVEPEDVEDAEVLDEAEPAMSTEIVDGRPPQLRDCPSYPGPDIIDARVDQMIRWITEMRPALERERLVKEHWDLAPRSAREYAKKARTRMAEHRDQSRTELVAEFDLQLEYLASASLATGNLPAALQAIKERIKLTGAAAPEERRVSLSLDDMSDEELQRIAGIGGDLFGDDDEGDGDDQDGDQEHGGGAGDGVEDELDPDDGDPSDDIDEDELVDLADEPSNEGDQE